MYSLSLSEPPPSSININKNISGKCHLFWFSGQPCKILPGLLLAVFVTCLGSSMVFGYIMASLDNTESYVKRFLKETNCLADIKNCTSVHYQSSLEFQYELLNFAYIISGTFACICSGILADKFGRRNILIANNIIGIIGSGCSLIIIWSNSQLSILVSRLFLGLNSGITAVVVPLFLVEISPTVIRGAIVAGHQLSVAIGIILAHLIKMNFVLNLWNNWNKILAFPMVMLALSFSFLFLIPETPRYLTSSSDSVATIKACFHYNKTQTIGEQLNEMRKEQEIFPQKRFKFWNFFSKNHNRNGILLSLAISAMPSLSGINAVVSYSKSIFLQLQFLEKTLEFYIFGMAVLNAIAILVGIFLIENKGRRKLFIYSSLMCILSLFGLFIFNGVIPNYFRSTNRILSFISLGCMIVYNISVAMGIGLIPGVVIVELFTQASRATGFSFSLGFQWASIYFISIFYPHINKCLPSGYIFIVFGLCIIFLLIIANFFMPETKDQSFIQIAENLRIQKSDSLT